MKYLFLSLIFLVSCTHAPTEEKEKVSNELEGLRGCFLLYNLKTDKMIKQVGETCYERFTAASTFKVPLAIMFFDSGILKDEFQVLKWDGKKGFIEHWNKNQNAKSWMQYSVVWFSQRLTPDLGVERMKDYLKKFNYGNQDISAGIRIAWLVRPGSNTPALRISPMEQLEFMKNLYRSKLPVSQRAMDITKDIMKQEKSPKGFQLSGKTGSSSYDELNKIQLGWFIAHLARGDEEYIVITNINDEEPYEGTSFGGMRAKDIMKRNLSSLGLW